MTETHIILIAAAALWIGILAWAAHKEAHDIRKTPDERERDRERTRH